MQTSVDIGRVGLWTGIIDAHSTSHGRELAQQIEAMGWPTLWRPESTGRDALVSCATLLDATTTLRLATGIAQIHARHSHTTASAQRTLAEASGGRFLLGLGVSHAPLVTGVRKLDYSTPFSDMVAYLAAMKEAPFMAVGPKELPPFVLAALGPKMLHLAATEASGAHPYFSPVEHTSYARGILGEALLAPEQMVVLDTDRERATDIAISHMNRYLRLPNYTNNLRRFGFGDDDIDAGNGQPSERLIDAIVVRGDVDAIVNRVRAHHDAGADHVCLQVLTKDPRESQVEAWNLLAEGLGLLRPAK